MTRRKKSIEQALLDLKYPMSYFRFSKTFKKICKQDRRFFIKLLKVFCESISNREVIHYASSSKLNLNQRGIFILLENRLIIVHTKSQAKIIHFNEIYFKQISHVEFDRFNSTIADSYGALFIKVNREQVGLKNFTIRNLKVEQLPYIAEFIRMRMKLENLE